MTDQRRRLMTPSIIFTTNHDYQPNTQSRNIRQDLFIAPCATLTGINALDMDSDGRIVEVVLGTEFQTMTDEQAIIKLGQKPAQAVRTESRSKL